ncbi:DUF600 family protein [Virgibacillus dakarensis]|nr:DUF600 family protein [Virgibacillus dakarensis]MTW86005.1 DUF600 family protein [Virgibacillus dakarensis]
MIPEEWEKVYLYGQLGEDEEQCYFIIYQNMVNLSAV